MDMIVVKGTNKVSSQQVMRFSSIREKKNKLKHKKERG